MCKAVERLSLPLFVSTFVTISDSGGCVMTKLTTAYISHGGPLPLLGDSSHTEMVTTLQQLVSDMDKPDLIIVVSAHWEAPFVSVQSNATPSCITITMVSLIRHIKLPILRKVIHMLLNTFVRRLVKMVLHRS